MTTYYAAWYGHLECLRYAHENGAPWDERTTSDAARNGHLDCLRYAHEHGAPWDERTTSYAARHGHLECLRYAYFRGCPWNDDSRQNRQEWNKAASTICRAWRRHHDARRRMAVSVIEASWLAHTYAPGGRGYARLAEAWPAKCGA
jgi:hypothetical protein